MEGHCCTGLGPVERPGGSGRAGARLGARRDGGLRERPSGARRETEGLTGAPQLSMAGAPRVGVAKILARRAVRGAGFERALRV